jgi:AraC family transcriptional regulator
MTCNEMSNRTANRQQSRVLRVVDYIERHLDRALSVTQLGRVAYLSKYHFHRQLSAQVGISPGKLVQLLRLKRASYSLVFGEKRSITQIAMDSHFANAESFSRAFRLAFGQSPSAFRRHPQWARWRARFAFLARLSAQRGSMTAVEIVTFPETKVAALEHRGAADDIYNTTRRFIEWRRANAVSPTTSRTYGIHYTRRDAPPEEYRMDICASIEIDVAPNTYGVVTKIIPALRCARMQHLGSRDYIACAEFLHREWLPNSGESAGDFPLIFHYVNVGPDVRDHDMITDVYLPLK